MDQYTMMDILGKAFADGEIDALRPLMAADCDYASQYANKSLSGVSKILSNMESVHNNIDETCAYTYKVIELESVLANGLTLVDLDNQAGMHPCPNCGRKMKQQFIGLQHCKCGISWKKDEGFFERTPDMIFALERRTIGGKVKQVPVIRYQSNQ